MWRQAELARRWTHGRGLAVLVELHQAYDGPWRDLVHHSGRVLQALSYQPSGAIVAAATTSLPEGVGGERNWDYRYSWVRDASFTMEALWVAACPDEADDFFAFLTTRRAVGRTGPALQIMFGVGGEHDLSERDAAAPGRLARQPPGAGRQRRLEPAADRRLRRAARGRVRLADQLADRRGHRRFLVACADTAAERWAEPDQGIWEVRGDPQHFLYSKVMCWVALDRAIALADVLGAARPGGRVDSRPARRSTRPSSGGLERRGRRVHPVLRLGRAGRLEPDDADRRLPARRRPADAGHDRRHRERLTDDRGLVYRYRTEGGVDGLAGEEGTFLLCTFWLAQALALAGQVERARAVFERAAAYANDVGLLAEEVDPGTGELLGNFPQAFSHIGLVNAAWAISQAASSKRQ